MADLTSNVSVAANVPERFVPESMRGESIEAEHFARYRWAAQFAAGRRVLDAGCGVGYGSAMLAKAGALEVIGVDLAADVVEDAAANYQLTNLVFAAENVEELAYEGRRFDLVVCFEVIEHLVNRDRALDEFRRVLAPDGLLVLSSPNRDTYPPGNPHHIHEYLPEELRSELQVRFSEVQLHRQHTWISSGILDDERFAAGDETRLDAETYKLADNQPGKELYTVALASVGTLPASATEPVMELSAPVELRRWDQLWHEQDDTLHQQNDLLQERESLIREHVTDLERNSHELWLLREQLASAERELARVPELEARTQELTSLNEELIELTDELDTLRELRDAYQIVVHSSSWKITRPLRRVGALVRKFTS